MRSELMSNKVLAKQNISGHATAVVIMSPK